MNHNQSLNPINHSSDGGCDMLNNLIYHVQDSGRASLAGMTY
ncbi:MAG: hypothetical protein SFU91_06265 [Chloroherpetonaceae bacterium]|nr:hypothetical protein [Chloroherpetonaceae bacterium]